MLTLGSKTPNFSRADVLIEDGKVADVGPGLRPRDAEKVDAADTIVMPGFVDTHRHVWRSLFRNLGTDELPQTSLRPDDVYAASLVGLLGAVEAGITTVVDWFDVELDDERVDAALQAHADAGVRTVFVPAGPDKPGPRDGPDHLIDRLHAAGRSAVTLAFGSHLPTSGDLDGVAAEWARARELGLRIHAHAGMDPSERGVVSALAGRGLLGEDVTLVHCSHADDEDLDAVASTRASLASTPSSEMARGAGPPPIQRLIDRGIRPGLGVDDERVAPGDMFAQMRAMISIQHATVFDRKLAGKAGLPQLMSTRDVIRHATIDGARVAGLGDVTGSLQPGKAADIVVLRTDRPNISPVNDPIGAVVWGMDTSNVDWVFVGGRALVRQGALQADAERARALATEAQARVATAAGLTAGSGGPA